MNYLGHSRNMSFYLHASHSLGGQLQIGGKIAKKAQPKHERVARLEIIKWLDAGIIFPISDSVWISPIHVVPKKGGTTIVKGKNDEIIPSRLVVEWRA